MQEGWPGGSYGRGNSMIPSAEVTPFHGAVPLSHLGGQGGGGADMRHFSYPMGQTSVGQRGVGQSSVGQSTGQLYMAHIPGSHVSPTMRSAIPPPTSHMHAPMASSVNDAYPQQHLLYGSSTGSAVRDNGVVGSNSLGFNPASSNHSAHQQQQYQQHQQHPHMHMHKHLYAMQQGLGLPAAGLSPLGVHVPRKRVLRRGVRRRDFSLLLETNADSETYHHHHQHQQHHSAVAGGTAQHSYASDSSLVINHHATAATAAAAGEDVDVDLGRPKKKPCTGQSKVGSGEEHSNSTWQAIHRRNK